MHYRPHIHVALQLRYLDATISAATDGRSVTGHLLRVVETEQGSGAAGEAPIPGITLLVGPKADALTLGWDEVARAKVEVEFSPPPAPVRERLEAELGPVAAAEPIDLTDAKPDEVVLEFDTQSAPGIKGSLHLRVRAWK